MNPITLFICQAALLMTAIAQPAAAESAESADPTRPIEELSVTASRVTTERSRATVPVEVIDELEIRDRQGSFLSSLLRGRNSIAVAQSGPMGGLTEVRVRGAESNHVQVRMDGIIINDPAIGSSVDFANLNLIGVRQLELLRGAQSGVWGSDALAGVINVDTTPLPDTETRRVSFETGSDDTYSSSLQLSNAGERLYYAASANHFETDGTNVATSGNEDDGYRNTTAHLNTGYRADRWGLSAVGRYTRARSQFDPTPFPDFVPADGDYDFHTTQSYAKLAGYFDVTSRWRHSLSYTYLDADNENKVEGNTTDSTDGGRDLVSYQSDYWFGSDNLAQRLTFAYEHSEEDYKQRGSASFFGDPNQDQSIDSDSLIGEYDLAWHNWHTTVSVRGDDNSEFDDDTTFRAGLRYALAATDATVFASYATGSKNPTFIERFGFTPDTFVGNPDLQPEESRSLNLGIEQPLGDFGEVHVTVFRDRLTDEIDGFFFDPNALAFTAVNRTGTSRRQGVELASHWRLPYGVMLDLDYSYLDATEPDAPGGQGDQDELRRPTHTGRALLRFNTAERLRTQLGVEYVGDRDDIDFGLFRRVQLGSYALVHMAVRYRITEHIELHGRAENALDEDYQDVFGYQPPGRQILFGISAEL